MSVQNIRDTERAARSLDYWDRDSLHPDFQEAISNLINEADSCTDAYADDLEEISNKDSTIAALEAEADDLDKALSEKHSEVQALLEENEALKRNNSLLEMKLNSASDEIERLENRLDGLYE